MHRHVHGALIRRLLSASMLTSLSLAPLAAAHAGSAPTGGRFVAGAGTIGGTGSNMVIDQTSKTGIIDWASFSIGAGDWVRFENGSGATLSRVTGPSISQIAGRLTATGSLYLIDPYGVLVSRSGRILTGGDFVASSRDVSNAAFMSGGGLAFSGSSEGNVVNQGAIEAGGDAVLIGSGVFNSGAISARGTAGLAAGDEVLLQPLGDEHIYVKSGSGDVYDQGTIRAAAAELKAAGGNVYALAGNTGGTISAVGTRTIAGHVWLTSATGDVEIGDTVAASNANGSGGVITARGSAIAVIGALDASAASRRGDGGSISLVAGRFLNFRGAASVAAGAAGGAGGEIETSGRVVDFTGKVDLAAAHGPAGALTIDPYNVTISAAATANGSLTGGLFTPSGDSSVLQAAALESALAGGDITVTTGAAGSPGAQAGDIVVSKSLTWSAATTLTLSAYRDITVNSGVVIFDKAAGAGLDLRADNSGAGVGAVSFAGAGPQAELAGGAVAIFYDPASYAHPTSYTASVQAHTLDAFMLVNSLADLQAMSTNLAGDYALGTSIDATASAALNGGAGFIPIGSFAKPFTGVFDGEGLSIRGLTIDRPTTNYVGLFGAAAATSTIENVGLADAQITGSSYVGGLAGADLGGTLTTAWVTGAVTGSNSDVGALVGDDTGSIQQSWAGGAVSAKSVSGGLAGFDSGSITQSYAIDSVTGSGADVGGLVGQTKAAAISQTYAIGKVTGASAAGGLIGASAGGSVASSYWDTKTTGQAKSAGGGTGLVTSKFFNAKSLSGFTFGGTPGAAGWVIVDFDGTLNNAAGAAGATRPMLLSEYSTTIANGHQLQLMELDPTASYSLASDIDLSSTKTSTDVWSAATGFVPIGGNATADFSGVFDGAGHTISGLTIHLVTAIAQTEADGTTNDGQAGLFGGIDRGVVSELTLAGADVTGAVGVTAGILAAGLYHGTVSDVGVSGKVDIGDSLSTSQQDAGGLIGVVDLGSSIVGSDSSATVTGGVSTLDGGLLGFLGSGSSLKTSHASGDVTAGDGLGTSAIAYAGGLIGFITGAIPTSAPATAQVTGSYATGAVTAGGGSVAGGFAGGVNEADITTSFASGSVTQTATGQDGESDLIGGFAGYIGATGVVSRSYASGAVKTVAGPSPSLYTVAGGFAGEVTGGSVSDAYATGSVTVEAGGGYNLVGGFSGLLTGGGSVTRVIAAGPVSESGALGPLGGLVGDLNGGSLTDSYWDEGTTGATVAIASCCDSGTTSGLVGMGGSTGVNPYAKATYVGFNFTSIWTAPVGSHYPTLRGLP